MNIIKREIAQAEQAALDEIHELEARFHTLIAKLGATRELSLAKTKIEEATLWVHKHLSL